MNKQVLRILETHTHILYELKKKMSAAEVRIETF